MNKPIVSWSAYATTFRSITSRTNANPRSVLPAPSENCEWRWRSPHRYPVVGILADDDGVADRADAVVLGGHVVCPGGLEPHALDPCQSVVPGERADPVRVDGPGAGRREGRRPVEPGTSRS